MGPLLMASENPYEPPLAMAARGRSPSNHHWRSRRAFFLQACSTIGCIVVGMSESYDWLAWAQPAIPVVYLLLPASVAFPAAVLAMSVRDRMTPGRTAVGVMLSVALSVASFLAIVPLCC